jgi:DNA invertase Pin-like site-specific DNA recombinase
VTLSAAQRLIQEYGIKNVINYLRKSRQDEERERKTGEDTLHEQKVLMERVLEGYGVPYDQEPEIGSGDKISSRPVFQKILEDIRNDKYDAIAVKEISRMGRGSYTDMGTIYDLIIEKRLFIITPWKIYDPKNPADLRQIRFELFMSREEFETTRERLTGGRYNAAIEGKWVAGKAPFGYTYNPNTKRLEINEEEAEVVRTIFDFYVNGIIVDGKRKQVSFRALASYLKRIGIKTPNGRDEWHPVRLREFLSNDRYIGRIRFRTTQRTADGRQIPRPEDEHIIVEDAHEPIIDPDTWERAQAKIAGRESIPRARLDFDPCELAGLCVCKKCGRKMVRQYNTQHYRKSDGEISVYRKEFLWCTTSGCTFVKYRNIEEDLLEVLKYLRELDDELLRSQLQVVLEDQKNEKGMSQEDMQRHIEMRREDLKRRMKFIYEKYESGIYTDEMFLERKAEVDRELAELENIKVEYSEPKKKEHIDPEIVRKNLSSILEAYQKATHKSDRNKILRAVFDHVVVEVIEKGRGRKQAKHVIYPVLKFNLLRSEFLI